MQGEVQVAKPEVVSDWEDELDEEEPVDCAVSALQAEWDDESALEEQQMAEIRKADEKKQAAAKEVEKKQQANHAKQMKANKKRSAAKPKLEFGPYAWLVGLTAGTDSKITEDTVFKGFAIPVQKRLLSMIQQSREAINHREAKAHEKISAIGYDGGGQGDETEIQILRGQSKKLTERFAQIWRTTTTEAKAWSASVKGEKKSPVTSSPGASSVVADIMSAIGRGTGLIAPATTPESTPKAAATAATPQQTERNAGFDIMAQAKKEAASNPAQFQCSRVCKSTRVGQQPVCPHRAKGNCCNWAHSVEQLKPKKCAWPTECNKWKKKGAACECAHLINGEWETSQAVLQRLLETEVLAKALPLQDTWKPRAKASAPTVAAVNAKMTQEEKRAATQKHREQLAALNADKSKGARGKQRTAGVVRQPPKVGPPPKAGTVWAKPPSMPKAVSSGLVQSTSPTESVGSVGSVSSTGSAVIKCTAPMAIQMLKMMKEGGLDDKLVRFEITE